MKRFFRAFAAAALFALTVPACDDSTQTGDEQNATDATGSFETFTAKDGKVYFQLLAKNGELILRSQGYSSLTSAKKGITSVKKNGLNESLYEVVEADSGEFYFNLKATNGQVIGTSEMYATESNADRGVDAVVAALQAPASAPAETGGARFETFKGADAKTYFRLRADNGQIVLQSQGYSSKSSAEGGVASVKKNGIDASRFDLVEGVDGQHTFRLLAANGQIIGRGEMYKTKSGALLGADRVRDILRALAGKGEASDSELKAEIERAAQGLTFMSESDFPFTFVSASMPKDAPITEDLVRSKMASFVDGDEAADKPMADLFAMEESFDEWKGAEHNCGDPEDPVGQELCSKMRNLEQVLEANLQDIHVFYFGANGEPGMVDGIGVSIIIVGRTKAGTLAGVRTIAIWT